MSWEKAWALVVCTLIKEQDQLTDRISLHPETENKRSFASLETPDNDALVMYVTDENPRWILRFNVVWPWQNPEIPKEALFCEWSSFLMRHHAAYTHNEIEGIDNDDDFVAYCKKMGKAETGVISRIAAMAIKTFPRPTFSCQGTVAQRIFLHRGSDVKVSIYLRNPSSRNDPDLSPTEESHWFCIETESMNVLDDARWTDKEREFFAVTQQAINLCEDYVTLKIPNVDTTDKFFEYCQQSLFSRVKSAGKR